IGTLTLQGGNSNDASAGLLEIIFPEQQISSGLNLRSVQEIEQFNVRTAQINLRLLAVSGFGESSVIVAGRIQVHRELGRVVQHVRKDDEAALAFDIMLTEGIDAHELHHLENG